MEQAKQQQAAASKETLVNVLIALIISMLSRVKMVNVDIKDDLAVVVKAIAKASARSKYDTMMDGYDLSDYKLDSHFKSLAQPCEVYVSSDIMDLNLKESDKIEEKVTPAQFIEAQANVLAAFKKTFNGDTNLLDATVEADLNSVLPIMTDGKKCHYSDSAFIPVQISIASKLRKKSYFSEDNKDMLRIYVETVLAPALRN